MLCNLIFGESLDKQGLPATICSYSAFTRNSSGWTQPFQKSSVLIPPEKSSEEQGATFEKATPDARE